MDTQVIHLRIVTISQRQYFFELEEEIVKGKTRITGEGGRLFYTIYVLEESDGLPWGVCSSNPPLYFNYYLSDLLLLILFITLRTTEMEKRLRYYSRACV